MYTLYKHLTASSAPALEFLLARRLKAGKEDPLRLGEKKGISSRTRPNGYLVWVHAASVGEAQSTLILINQLLEKYADINILVTTGTLSSAAMMTQKLPSRAFHQFYPLDHPRWTQKFLDHWRPDFILWMESELWPNMLAQIRTSEIPAVLVNARLSPKSFRRWSRMKSLMGDMLLTFKKILCQTEKEAEYFKHLGARHVVITGNLKYSAQPLGFDKTDFQTILTRISGRPLWLYASTHAGEEEIAARTHQTLKSYLPDLLTIIVPRHPERRAEIAETLKNTGLKTLFRGGDKTLPQEDTDLYIADTLGELGLFYRLAPIACIGRSFSLDGGGGHNPIEAAQLGCAIIHGPNVQNLQDIFDDMNRASAAARVTNEAQLADTLLMMLRDENKRQALQKNAQNFVQSRSAVADQVLREITELMPHAA